MAIKDIITFLADLKDNNNKEWFASQKKQYEALREDFTSIVEGILKELSEFVPEMSTCKAKSCLFRINRDVRFSADKSPYKTNFGAYFNPEGKTSPKGGYYLHLEPGQSFLGGGLYMPAPDLLKKVRQEVDYNFGAFTSIVQEPTFKKWFPQPLEEGKLSRPPKGYDASNPAIEFLKLKHYVYGHDFDALGYSSKQELVNMASEAYKTLTPFIKFVNHAIEE